MKKALFLVLGMMIASYGHADEKKEKAKSLKPRFKSAGKLSFDSLLVEGQERKSQVSIVTGNNGKSDKGLIKLRENFVENISEDAGEMIE